MKKTILITLSAVFSISMHAQLKVEPNGSVGLGTTTPYTAFPVTIDQQVADAGAVLINYNNGAHALKLGQYPANGHIGSSNDELVFYYIGTPGYNKVTAQSYHLGSDRNIKTNIKSLEKGMDVVMKLNSVSYFMKEDVEQGKPRMTYGFISQEVEEFLPELTKRQMDVLCLDYIQIIPFMVRGMQEQQVLIKNQEEHISALQKEIKTINVQLEKIPAISTVKMEAKNAILYQNKPNPFSERTVVKYELPEKCNAASILVFDMAGTLLETYPLSVTSNGELTIEGRQFKPGMYLYSLIIDGEEVDTKKMILNK